MIVQPRLSCVCGDVLNSIRITLCCGTFPPRKVYTLQNQVVTKELICKRFYRIGSISDQGLSLLDAVAREPVFFFFSMKFKRDEKNAKIRR